MITEHKLPSCSFHRYRKTFQYRLARRWISQDVYETVLQGMFEWEDDNGLHGFSWKTIPTVDLPFEPNEKHD
ncbi:MAG: hypothetical protein NUV74_05450 [Candidatus Brocadiaceae bacterium]|nr:hypothetical protein [Candidatus Brocadiaceae bacterium]